MTYERASRDTRVSLATSAVENSPYARIWAVSLGVWTFFSFAATATVYELYRHSPNPMPLTTIAGMEFTQLLAYAPLTPFVYLLSLRFPIQRSNWLRRCWLHLGFALVFTLGHISLRSVTPYGFWDPVYREWSSAIWNAHLHAFRAPWGVLRDMFFSSVFDDITSAYMPIVLVALAVAYYRRSRDEEVRSTVLEAQLANARLQTLKNQLQPHFLFNTLHSISALMLTDVEAADRMICRLSDLLRVSLDAANTQITTLKRELEFVNCYLEIEKIRFEERLRVTYDIAPETLDAEVPHLLLQPIVDNAVKHGISKVSQGGEITIVASRRRNTLHIEVRNSGGDSGLFRTPRMNGVGLMVTRERLDSLYGSEHSFELADSPGGIVTARICIPLAGGGSKAAADETVSAVSGQTK